MSATTTFHIRGLSEGIEDGQFMIDAFDASLPALAAIGSGGQWGLTPFAERPNVGARAKIFEQAQGYQSTGEGDPISMFIVEAEVSPEALAELPDSVYVRTVGDKKLLAVGSVMLSEGIYPKYLNDHFDKEAIRKPLDGTSDYIYLEALITDYRTGPWRRGAGAALIEHARRFCREKGKSTIFVDSYAGNDRKLVKYYEKQGFTIVSDFESPKPDGSTWPGTFYRMDVVTA
ncbi:acetyltransferase [Nemania abortiva]|nr:acetyltransferase [Nemania abortiva]